MHIRTRDLKNRAEELLDNYDEAMIDDLIQLVIDELKGMTVEEIEDEDFWLGIIQSWSPQDPDEWSFDAVQSELDDIGDQKYEEEKDRRMGL